MGSRYERVGRRHVRPHGPWWFRFLMRRIDRAYGYGRWRSPNETSFRYALGAAYESTVQTLGRRRGWIDLPTQVTPSTPLRWVFVAELGMALNGEMRRRWEEWRSVA